MELVLRLEATYEGQPLPADLQVIADRVMKDEKAKLRSREQASASSKYAVLSASKNGK